MHANGIKRANDALELLLRENSDALNLNPLSAHLPFKRKAMILHPLSFLQNKITSLPADICSCLVIETISLLAKLVDTRAQDLDDTAAKITFFCEMASISCFSH